MAKGLHVRLENVERLKKSFKDKGKVLAEGIDEELNAFVLDVNKDQKSRTPIDTGVLAKGNNFRIDTPFHKEIFNNVKYSPYVEFGTGGKVKIPKGLEKIAEQFKGKGIKEVNLPARPFFFPPFFERKKDLIKRIIKLLNK